MKKDKIRHQYLFFVEDNQNFKIQKFDFGSTNFLSISEKVIGKWLLRVLRDCFNANWVIHTNKFSKDPSKLFPEIEKEIKETLSGIVFCQNMNINYRKELLFYIETKNLGLSLFMGDVNV